MAPSDQAGPKHPTFLDEVFEVQSVQAGDALCVLVSGELHVGSADELEVAIRLAEKATDGAIVVDLSKVRFMDSVGLGVLLRAHTRSRDDGDRIRFLPSKYDAVRQLVAITDSSRIFD